MTPCAWHQNIVTYMLVFSVGQYVINNANADYHALCAIFSNLIRPWCCYQTHKVVYTVNKVAY